jgi:hypothetical protein
MPLPPPNPPAVNTPLPPQPQDPATLVDISNAIAYSKQVLVSHGMIGTSFFMTRFSSPPEAGVATKDQVGAGAVYQAALIAQNSGGGMMSPCNSIGTLIDHLSSAVAPPWFAPALAAGLAPLTRVAHIVS